MPDEPSAPRKNEYMDVIINADHQDKRAVDSYIASITNPTSTPDTQKKAGKDLVAHYASLAEYMASNGDSAKETNPGYAERIIRRTGVLQQLEQQLEKIVDYVSKRGPADIRDLVQGESVNRDHPLFKLSEALQLPRQIIYLGELESIPQKDEEKISDEEATGRKNARRYALGMDLIRKSYLLKEKPET